MWYGNNKFIKESTSLGMYTESIAKNLARDAMDNLILFYKQCTVDENLFLKITKRPYEMPLYISESLNSLQVDKPTRVKLTNYFWDLGTRATIKIKCKTGESNNYFSVRGAINIEFGTETQKIETDTPIEIFIFIGVISQSDFIPTMQRILTEKYSNIYKQIAEVCRHELQHYVQVTPHGLRNKPKKSVYENQKLAPSSFTNYYDRKKSKFNYLGQTVEIDAYVSGLYMTAKSQKIPFHIYLDTFIDNVADGITTEIIEKKIIQFEKINKKEMETRDLADAAESIIDEAVQKLIFLKQAYYNHARQKYNLPKITNLDNRERFLIFTTRGTLLKYLEKISK